MGDRVRRFPGLVRALEWTIAVGVVLGALAVAGGDWLRERSQIARALTWLDADVGDIDRFPARPIPTGPTVDALRPGSGHGYLFEPVTLVQDGDTATTEFGEFLESQGTWAFIVLRGDSLVFERYFGEKGPESLFTTFSASKSVLSAAVGAAVDRGLIGGLDDPVTDYVPELLDRDARFERVTLRHLMSMSSGLAYDGAATPWSDDATTYYAPNLRRAALGARIAGSPGLTFLYNNYNPLLVGLALERATGRPLSDFLAETIWSPLGTEAAATWSVDSETHGFEKMESGFNARARDLARFGRMYLREGEGPRGPVLSAAWVRESVAADSISDPSIRYQHFWWVRPGDGSPDEFYADGRFGQFIYVVPDLDMVMVRLGHDDGVIDWPRFLSGRAAMVRAAESGQVSGTHD